MAATRGTVQGHQRDGRAQQEERSALGHGYTTAKANTWQTFATITTWADGHGSFELRQHGKLIKTFDWTDEAHTSCPSCLDVPGKDGLGRPCKTCDGTGQVAAA